MRAYLSAGRSYLHQHMCQEAIAAFEKARELSPNSPVPLALLAHAYNVSGRQSGGGPAGDWPWTAVALHAVFRLTCWHASAYLGFDHDRAFRVAGESLRTSTTPGSLTSTSRRSLMTCRKDPRFYGAGEESGTCGIGAAREHQSKRLAHAFSSRAAGAGTVH